VRSATFFAVSIVVALLVFALARALNNDYLFFAGYTVVQFVVLATAWNILGGYCGYVNFGTAAFFALGAYSTVFFHKTYPLPVPVLLAVAAVVSGLIGLGTGYLTLRLRGAFFSIATLALAVVLQTFVVNWNYVGGSRGAYVIRPSDVDILGFQLPYIQYLCLIMLVLAAVSIAIARTIERSKLGYGFATIRDDELAAEASGVPTLKLKLVATTLSGALMGMAGAPFPYYIGYLEPASAFGLPYAVNSIAMPMIGGTTIWFGPLIGSLLLGILTQIATVTISSAVNLLLVGVLLVGFVIVAPSGLVGLLQQFLRVAAPARVDARAVGIIFFASFAFIVGLLEVVFGLASITRSPDTAELALATSGLVVAALLLASAYGLLTMQGRSPLLATLAFALSIPIDALQLSLDPTPSSLAYRGLGIAVAVAAVCWFQLRNVRQLYQPRLAERRAAA
jgi:branched-chain amino acid transport system permease protein